MSEEVKSTSISSDTTGKVTESTKQADDKPVAASEDKHDDKVMRVPANYDFRPGCSFAKLECYKCHEESSVCVTHCHFDTIKYLCIECGDYE